MTAASETWAPQGPPDPPEPPPGADAWPPWIAPLGLVAAMVVAFVGGALVLGLGLIGGGDADDPAPGVIMGGTLVQDVAFVGAAILFVRMAVPNRPIWPPHFGLRGTAFWPAVGWTVAVYAGFLVFAAVWSTLVEVDANDEVLDDLGVSESALALVGAAILVCVLAPLVEELFFRGFFFRALRNWRGFWPAAVATGAVFGVIHIGSAEPAAMVPLGVLGFGLCVLYEKTGSLYPCIALHCINNALAFGVSEKWDWQIAVLAAVGLAACALLVGGVVRRWRG